MRLLATVEYDGGTPMVNALRRGLANRRQMNAACAASMVVPIQQNFLRLSGTNHNAFGAPSTFWALMNAGTRAGADDQGGWVSMPRPVALRFFGGTVYPGDGKERLALPARTEAYNKSPRDFSDLRLVLFGMGAGGVRTMALVQNDQQKIKYGRAKQKGGPRPIVPGDVIGGGVFFWLVPSATIRPDPAVLPATEVLEAAAIEGLRGYLSHLARRAA